VVVGVGEGAGGGGGGAGFGGGLAAGAVLPAGGDLLRLAGPESFAWALAGQLVVAAGQPLVLNSITKVAARYFPEQERTAAISAGTASLYVGILAAVLGGGPLFDAGGLRLLGCRPAAVAGGAGARVGCGCWCPCRPPWRSSRRPGCSWRSARPRRSGGTRRSPCRCAGCGATAFCGCWRACCSSGWACSTRSRPGSIRYSATSGGAAPPGT